MANVQHRSSSSSFCPRVEMLTSEATHNAVKAEKLSVFVGKLCLLRNADITIAEHLRTVEVRTPLGEARHVKSGLCYGLVGPNGCGKSTILKLMAQRDLPIPRTWDVCYVSQQLSREIGRTPVEEVLSGNARRMELLDLVSSLENEIVSLAESAEAADAIEAASKRLVEVNDELGAFDKEEKVVEHLLIGLGFRHEQDCKEPASDGMCSSPSLSTPISRLSGGWRMRVQLAKALWLQPKLLLLDEPTNHLDVHALLWLEDRLREYPHTAVVVSHDVSFLHSTCWEILWINEQKVESMPRDAVSQEDLARMQRRKSLRFRFKCADDADKHGLSLHNVAFDYVHDVSDKKRRAPLLRVPGNVRLTGKSRAVLLGRNGSGKSTFLALCTRVLQPGRGTVDHTQGLKIGHFSQDTDSIDQCHEPPAKYLLRYHREALETRAGDGASERRLLEEARAVLSPFGIENELAVGIPTLQLSGGQKVCLKFAVLSMYPAHVLVLDEPTNHLDAAGRESLARGLADFEGGLLLVTHDNELIYRLVECSQGELLICQDGVVRSEREWGRHRLHTLRDEVRKAQEADAVAEARAADIARGAKQSRPAKLSISKKLVEAPSLSSKFEPSTPPGFVRVSKRPTFEPPTLLRANVDRRSKCFTEKKVVVSLPGQVDGQVDDSALPQTSLAQNVQTVLEHPGVAVEDAEDQSKPHENHDSCFLRDKRIRSLRKKMQQISKLKTSVAELDAAAQAKIASEADVIRELEALERGEGLSSMQLHDQRHEASSPKGATSESVSPVKAEPPDLSANDLPTSGTACTTQTSTRLTHPSRELHAAPDEINRTEIAGDDDLPESWEEMVDDCVDVQTGLASSHSAEKLSNSSHADDVFTGDDLNSSSDMPESWEDIEPSCLNSRIASCVDASADATRGLAVSSQGHRSRFRKDLINLNKAVSKWFRQEKSGAISRNVIVDRILDSPAALHLKACLQSEFNEAVFLNDVLARAGNM